MRSRKLLALLFCLITFPAIAGYMTLLGAGVGSIAPVVSWVSGTDAFPSTLSFSRTSNATMFDSTGKLTYAPNNLALYANDYSNAYWGAAYDAGNTRSVSGINFTSSTGYAYSTISGIPAGAQVVASVVISTGSKTDAVGLREVVSGTQVSIQPTATPTRYYLKITAGAVVQIGLDNRVAQGGGGGTGTLNVSGWAISVVTYEFANNAQSPNDYSVAFWGSAYDAGNTRSTTAINFTASSGYAYANVTGIGSGRSVVASVTLTAGTKVGTVILRDATTGSSAVITPTATATTYYLRFTSGAGIALGLDNRVGLGGDGNTGTVTVSNWNIMDVSPRQGDIVTTTSAAYYGPRIDYDPNTLAVKGLLIEEARTNLQPNSGALNGANWSVSNVTKSATATGPDGVAASAQTFTASAGSAAHFAVYATNATIVSGSTYSYTVFAKAGTSNFAVVNLYGNAAGHWASAVFDLSNVSNSAASQTAQGATSGTVASTGQQYLGNGWFRLRVTGSINTTQFDAIFGFAGAATGNTFDTFGCVTFSAAGSETLSFYGPQIELGSFATSYIPTDASAVTRAADVVQFTGAALTALQGASHSLLVQTSDVAAFGLNLAGAGNDYQQIYNSSTVFSSRNINGGLTVTLPSGTFASPQRVGYATNGTTRSVVASGAINTGSGGYAPVGSVYLGAYSSGAFMPNIHVTSLAVWNQRLPDATLQAKSVVGASYAANDNGLRFADNDNLPIHWRVAL